MSSDVQDPWKRWAWLLFRLREEMNWVDDQDQRR
jgi:hypothetical protein